jgi:hypothetical protein
MKLIVPDSEPTRILAFVVEAPPSRRMETRYISFSFGFLVRSVLLWSVRSKTKISSSFPLVMMPVIAKRSERGELSSAVGSEKGEWSRSFLNVSKERGFSQGAVSVALTVKAEAPASSGVAKIRAVKRLMRVLRSIG